MGEKNRPLAGKVIWVIGSSRGIGRVIATHMARLGANVAVHGTTPFSTQAFNEADSLEGVAKAMAAEHAVDVLPVHGDLSDESTVKTVPIQIKERFGPMDIVVKNAGGDIGSQETFKDTRNEGGGDRNIRRMISEEYLTKLW